MSIFKDLKERRLFQIVASYLVAGWIALAVTRQLIGHGRLPELAYDVALIWYLGGIGGALLVGWYHGDKGKRRAPLAEVLAMSLIGVAVIGFSGFSVIDHVSERRALAAMEASALDLDRIAVTYFHDLTPTGELGHLADGITESLIDELTDVRDLEILSRGAVAPFRGDRPTLDSIGRALRAGTMVDGVIDRMGDRLRILIRLVDGQSGVELSRARIEIPVSEPLAARGAVIEETARRLGDHLGRELRMPDTRSGTAIPDAWTLYQRAEQARKEGETAVIEAGPDEVAAAFDRADSLLAQARRLDPDWPAPAVLRAHIAYRRSRLEAELDDVLGWIDVGLEQANEALAIAERSARALEVRGTLKYWHWLLGVIPDRDRSDALFLEAREDLEKAVDLDDGLASAHASLSHLYLNASDLPATVLAGRRAYEEDAYLEDADRVVWRLVTASNSLRDYREMSRWCRIGRQRFPADSRFVACELQAMATRVIEPDVPAAWALLARLDSLAPPNQLEWDRIRGQLAVGGVLARAGLPDSASAVLDRAHDRITIDIDPEGDLYLLEARMRARLDQPDRAIDLLKLYAAANPGTSFDEDGWWHALRSHPRWREIVRGG